MKRKLLFIILLVPLYSGCTVLGVETERTETVTTTQSENQSQYKSLEARVEELERRVNILEQRAQDRD